MNERRWKWSLIESEASVLFCISVWQPQPRCSEFPTGGSSVFHLTPPPFRFFFFFTLGRTVLRRQWRNSIFICFLLFGFHRKGRWAFMCLICHSNDSVPAFKALGAVWTKPSVWVGRFIKWQTGSFYLANVSRGRWQWLVCYVRVCVCVRVTGRDRRTEGEREVEKGQIFLCKHCNKPLKRPHHWCSCHLRTERFLPLWIYNDNWIRKPFSFHLIPWNTG